jgi:hypothetical protein
MRYLLALLFSIISAYRSDISVCPETFENSDPMFSSFRAMLAMHAAERGLIVRKVEPDFINPQKARRFFENNSYIIPEEYTSIN